MASRSAIKIPQRTSLVFQAAEAIRQGIRKKEWHETLPAESRLCRQLQVSCSTLRKALSLLREEGVIRTRHGLSSRIVSSRRRKKTRSNVVASIIEAPLYEVSRQIMFACAHLDRQLHREGFKVREIIDARYSLHHGIRRFRKLLDEVNPACWVLFCSTYEEQLWLEENRIPSLIFGHCYPGIKLPSVSVNYEAVCRHAVERLVRLGHRQIALLMPDRLDAGYIARESGFKKEIALYAKEGVVGTVLKHHHGGGDSISSLLDSVIYSSNAPTGFIVTGAWHAITVTSHLNYHGIHVPKNASVISTDFELVLMANVPEIATYRIDYNRMGVTLARQVLRLANTGALPPRPKWIYPRFVEGQTLRKLR